MNKRVIELAYDRMNHELGIHWNRINLTWLIVTAAFSATGYMLFEISKVPPASDAGRRTHEVMHLLLVMASSAALVASVVWRVIIDSGNYWVQVWEQKIGVMELHAGRPLYLSLDGNEQSVEGILRDYRERFGLRPKKHPSITVAFSHLSLVAIIAAFALLLVLVLAPNQLGVVSASDWRHYTVFAAAIFWSIIIEWPIAIDLRKNNRLISKTTVKILQDMIDNEIRHEFQHRG